MAMQYKLKDPGYLARLNQSKDFQENLQQSCLEDFGKQYNSYVLVTISIPKSEIIAEDVCPEKDLLKAAKERITEAVYCLKAGDTAGALRWLGEGK